MNVAIIGAGNGGQALAGLLASKGCNVTICDVNRVIIEELNNDTTIELTGHINAKGIIVNATVDAADAIKGSELILIVTTAIAHGPLARQLAPVLEDGQTVILCPGRTGGALVFRQELEKTGFSKRIYLAEAQTLLYACRLIKTGVVNIVGVKDSVRIAALPSSDTGHVINILNQYFSVFVPSPNILWTSLENYGAVFHSANVIFNAAAIERGESFYFYRDMTPQVVSFIEKLDNERINVAKAYGIELMTASEWLEKTYGVTGVSLYERMVNNEAYKSILAPKYIRCRQLTEDVPTGAIPIVELGKAAGVDVNAFESLINITQELLSDNFVTTARTLERLGFKGLSKPQIINKIH